MEVNRQGLLGVRRLIKRGVHVQSQANATHTEAPEIFAERPQGDLVRSSLPGGAVPACKRPVRDQRTDFGEAAHTKEVSHYLPLGVTWRHVQIQQRSAAQALRVDLLVEPDGMLPGAQEKVGRDSVVNKDLHQLADHRESSIDAGHLAEADALEGRAGSLLALGHQGAVEAPASRRGHQRRALQPAAGPNVELLAHSTVGPELHLHCGRARPWLTLQVGRQPLLHLQPDMVIRQPKQPSDFCTGMDALIQE
mmetsp:Transcript_36041/g.84311  ORF Transcript_36041/g.84311 Transcript_36041/m.84311 type:complete len:251 (+) Transcript_36041:102-854(+)